MQRLLALIFFDIILVTIKQILFFTWCFSFICEVTHTRIEGDVLRLFHCFQNFSMSS